MHSIFDFFYIAMTLPRQLGKLESILGPSVFMPFFSVPSSKVKHAQVNIIFSLIAFKAAPMRIVSVLRSLTWLVGTHFNFNQLFYICKISS